MLYWYIKGETTEKCLHEFSLNWSCHQSKDSVHLVPSSIHLYITSSYTYTHLGFAELGTKTFNINVIPGQSEKWLSEHFQSTYSSTGPCPAVAMLWNDHIRLNHIQTISQTVTWAVFAFFLFLQFKFRKFIVLSCLCRTLQEYAKYITR